MNNTDGTDLSHVNPNQSSAVLLQPAGLGCTGREHCDRGGTGQGLRMALHRASHSPP